MRPMTNPPLLSPSPCPLLRRLLHLSRASRRRNPTAGPPPPCTFRRRLPRLLPTAMSSDSTTAPDSVVADPTTLARKVADIRAAGPAKLQVGTPFVLNTVWLLASLLCGILTRTFAQVIADFDGTLTRYWYDGARGQSTFSLLLHKFSEVLAIQILDVLSGLSVSLFVGAR